jgi:peptidoglycan/LPS O-acetylase OafA/YrhL
VLFALALAVISYYGLEQPVLRLREKSADARKVKAAYATAA